MVLALGGLMLGVGLAFKLSAVPFHFWCPDVFEGAAAEIGGFLVRGVEGGGAGAAGPRRHWAWATTERDGSRRGARSARRPRRRRRSRRAHRQVRLVASRRRSATGSMRRRRRQPRRQPRRRIAAVARAPLLRHAHGARRDRHLHVRQSGRLRPEEHQADAGLLDDRPRRLHDDARRRRAWRWPAATSRRCRDGDRRPCCSTPRSTCS